MSNDRPSLSVVIPVYNGEKHIRRCIESIRKQAYKPEKIIVVNDGSTDKTADILSDMGVQTLVHERNLGLAAARNTGLNSTNTEIVAFFDSDTGVPTDYIETMMAHFAAGNKYDGVGGHEVPKYTDGASNYYRAKYLYQGVKCTAPVERRVLYGLAMAFRRDKLLNAGGFDTFFRTNGEDVDICLRMYLKGSRFLYDPNLYVYHYKRDNFRSLVIMVYRYGIYGSLAITKNLKKKPRGLDIFTRDRLPREIKVIPLFLFTVAAQFLSVIVSRHYARKLWGS